GYSASTAAAYGLAAGTGAQTLAIGYASSGASARSLIATAQPAERTLTKAASTAEAHGLATAEGIPDASVLSLQYAEGGACAYPIGVVARPATRPRGKAAGPAAGHALRIGRGLRLGKATAPGAGHALRVQASPAARLLAYAQSVAAGYPVATLDGT